MTTNSEPSARYYPARSLGDLLQHIEQYVESADGMLIIFMSEDTEEVDANTLATVGISLHEETEVEMAEIAAVDGMFPYCDLELANSVVSVARDYLSAPTSEQLVIALEYYLDNDAFMHFS